MPVFSFVGHKCGRAFISPNNCFSSHQSRKGYLSSHAPFKGGAANKRLSVIFSFTAKHARSYHFCTDVKWTLWSLLLRGPSLSDLSSLKAVFSAACLVGKQSTMVRLWISLPLTDQYSALLVCFSELMFEFVLGGDPDRLTRVTEKLRSQPAGPGGTAGIASHGFLFSRAGPQTSFHHCLISD